MRQTGGCAVGETSTRSRVFSLAILSASKGVMMPNWFPSSSITRTSRTRIRSLVRINLLSIPSSGETYSNQKYSTVRRAIHGYRALECARGAGLRACRQRRKGPPIRAAHNSCQRRRALRAPTEKLLRFATASEAGESDQARAQQDQRARLGNRTVVQRGDREVLEVGPAGFFEYDFGDIGTSLVFCADEYGGADVGIAHATFRHR